MSDAFRTPLGRVRGAGSAGEGSGHFIAQRVSAIILALLAPYLVISAALSLDETYASAREWVSSPWIAPALALALFTAIYHMQIGMQVIIEDYIAKPVSRAALSFLNLFVCLVLAAAGAFAILKIFLGA